MIFKGGSLEPPFSVFYFDLSNYSKSFTVKYLVT
jgi:hypothetical protein